MEPRFIKSKGFAVSLFEAHEREDTPTKHHKAALSFDLRDVSRLGISGDPTAPKTSVHVQVKSRSLTIDFRDLRNMEAWLALWVNAVPGHACNEGMVEKFASPSAYRAIHDAAQAIPRSKTGARRDHGEELAAQDAASGEDSGLVVRDGWVDWTKKSSSDDGKAQPVYMHCVVRSLPPTLPAATFCPRSAPNTPRPRLPVQGFILEWYLKKPVHGRRAKPYKVIDLRHVKLLDVGATADTMRLHAKGSVFRLKATSADDCRCWLAHLASVVPEDALGQDVRSMRSAATVAKLEEAHRQQQKPRRTILGTRKKAEFKQAPNVSRLTLVRAVSKLTSLSVSTVGGAASSSDHDDERHEAATKLQAMGRGALGRLLTESMKEDARAAREKSNMKEEEAIKASRRVRETQIEAASAMKNLQKAKWQAEEAHRKAKSLTHRRGVGTVDDAARGDTIPDSPCRPPSPVKEGMSVRSRQAEMVAAELDAALREAEEVERKAARAAARAAAEEAETMRQLKSAEMAADVAEAEAEAARHQAATTLQRYTVKRFSPEDTEKLFRYDLRMQEQRVLHATSAHVEALEAIKLAERTLVEARRMEKQALVNLESDRHHAKTLVTTEAALRLAHGDRPGVRSRESSGSSTPSQNYSPDSPRRAKRLAGMSDLLLAKGRGLLTIAIKDGDQRRAVEVDARAAKIRTMARSMAAQRLQRQARARQRVRTELADRQSGAVEYEELHEAAVRMQAMARGNSARNLFDELKKSAAAPASPIERSPLHARANGAVRHHSEHAGGVTVMSAVEVAESVRLAEKRLTIAREGCRQASVELAAQRARLRIIRASYDSSPIARCLNAVRRCCIAGQISRLRAQRPDL